MRKILLWIVIISLAISFVSVSFVDAGSSITFPGNKVKMSIISQSPDPVKPGEFFDLKVRVQVLSSAARENFQIKNLKIEMIQEYPFSVAENENRLRDLGTLGGSEARDVTYRIKTASDAADGVNRLRFKYSSDSGGEVEGEGYLSVNVRAIESTLGIASLKSNPERIPAGGEAELELKLKNSATSYMRDVAVKLDLSNTPFTPMETSSEKRIAGLAPGQEANMNFKIIVDTNAESKPYKIPVVLTYLDDQNNKFSRNDSIGLLVYSEPELDFNIDDSKIFRKGDNGEIIIAVSNIGPSKVKFINLEALVSEDYKVIGNNKIYLGNLDPDDFQTASFKIYAAKSNPKILLKVVYKDAYNKDFFKEVELQLKTYSGREAAAYGLVKPSFGILQWVFLILALIFLYHVYRGLRGKLSLGAAIMHGFKRTIIHIGRFILFFRWSKLKTLPGKLKRMLKDDGHIK